VTARPLRSATGGVARSPWRMTSATGSVPGIAPPPATPSHDRDSPHQRAMVAVCASPQWPNVVGDLLCLEDDLADALRVLSLLAAVRATSDRAVAGEVIYGKPGERIVRHNIGRVIRVR
jgi:hypothetical protein